MAEKPSSNAIRSQLRLIKDASPEQMIEDPTFILQQLNHQDPSIRSLAVECLWDYPDPEAAGRLLTLTKSDPDGSVRIKAITALGRYMYEGEMEMYDLEEGSWEDPYTEPVMTAEQFKRMRDFLIATCQDPRKSLDERRFALEVVSFLSSDEVRQLIKEAYASDQKQMRISALFAIGRNMSNELWNLVIESLHDEDADIRAEAIRSAGECQIEEAHDQLMFLAKTTTDQEEFRSTIMAIAALGLEQSLAFLGELELGATGEADREFAEAAMDEWMFNNEIRRQADEESPDDFDFI